MDLSECKTITEMLEKIAEEMCEKYCKYPSEWDEDIDGELCDSDICRNCPLNKLC